jgi:hypothetical protein
METGDKYAEWAIKSAAETLVRAEEIKKDEKLMALVKGELDKSAQAIKSIKELRGVAAKVRSEPAEESEEEEDEVDEKLMTEEDKAALQEKKKVDKNLSKFKKKGE